MRVIHTLCCAVCRSGSIALMCTPCVCEGQLRGLVIGTGRCPQSAKRSRHDSCGRICFLYFKAVGPGSNLYAQVRSLQTSNTFKGVGVMAMHLVAGLDFPSQLATAMAPYFLLGCNSAGYWVTRETSGRRAGLFRTREAALKYARDESPNGNFTILHQPEGLELEPAQVRRAA
jgi:hypothetical protein